MEHQSKKKMVDETAPEPSNVPILCENNCGFFGSPATNNLCSKCHKDYLLKHSKAAAAAAAVAVEKNDVGVGGGVELKIGDGEVGGGAEEVKVDQGASSGSREVGPANRCSFCKKRVGLTGFKCRCEHTFCSVHRYSDKHNCMFDYKTAAQDAIAKANPIVKADKVDKI